MYSDEHRSNVAGLAKSRLTWLERNLWFRRAVSALMRPPTVEDYFIIEMLPVLLRLNGSAATQRSGALPAVLAVLTSHEVLLFHVLWSSKVSAFPSDRLVSFVYEAPAVRVFTRTPGNPASKNCIELIHDAARFAAAQRFALVANLLVTHRSWGNPEKIKALIDEGLQ